MVHDSLDGCLDRLFDTLNICMFVILASQSFDQATLVQEPMKPLSVPFKSLVPRLCSAGVLLGLEPTLTRLQLSAPLLPVSMERGTFAF